mmetsp:Transcript_29609/g.33947  ORF Transcript_29609/g.33947 Transcript_29609/m.33947 type:complete len:88 (+) Transcript_29609:114-377(+)
MPLPPSIHRSRDCYGEEDYSSSKTAPAYGSFGSFERGLFLSFFFLSGMNRVSGTAYINHNQQQTVCGLLLTPVFSSCRESSRPSKKM